MLPRSPAAKPGLLPTRGHREDPLESPDDDAGDLQVWAPAQARAFVEHTAGERLAALYVVALGTGMRRGELLGLRWQDVDWQDGHASAARIRIRQALVLAGGRTRMETPKSARSRRSIVVSAPVLEALKRHRATQAEERLAWGSAYDERGLGLVFAREDGSPLAPGAVSRAFLSATEAVGLPRIRFHDLRHTFATHALAAGMPLHALSRYLGHSSIAITDGVYGHMLADDEERHARQVGALQWGATGS